MKVISNYNNPEAVYKKIQGKGSFLQFSFDSQILKGNFSNVGAYFSDNISRYFAYAEVKDKEQVENAISTILFEIIDYVSFIVDNKLTEQLKVNLAFISSVKKNLYLEFYNIYIEKNRISEVSELMNLIGKRNCSEQYFKILEGTDTSSANSRNFCIISLVHDYKVKLMFSFDEKNENKINKLTLLLDNF